MTKEERLKLTKAKALRHLVAHFDELTSVYFNTDISRSLAFETAAKIVKRYLP